MIRACLRCVAAGRDAGGGAPRLADSGQHTTADGDFNEIAVAEGMPLNGTRATLHFELPGGREGVNQQQHTG